MQPYAAYPFICTLLKFYFPGLLHHSCFFVTNISWHSHRRGHHESLSPRIHCCSQGWTGQQQILSRILSHCILEKTSRDKDSTASLWRLFQWLVSLQTFLPYVKMKLLRVLLVPIAPGLLHVSPSEKKRLCPVCSRSLGTGIPWWDPSYVFSRVKRPNSFNLSQQARFSNLLIIFLALPWALSSLSAPFLNGEYQAWTQYSKGGLGHAEYSGWHIFISASKALMDAAQDLICLCCYNLTHAPIVVH